MTLAIVVGAQWGDEGKGKPIEILAQQADLIVAWVSGSNAGRAMVIDGERIVLSLVPGPFLRAGKDCLLAQGAALDPIVLLRELDLLGTTSGKMLVDQRAHVVLPHHVEIDRLRNEIEGASGVPRTGIGPCYADKISRRGVQVGDLLVPQRLDEKVRGALDAAAPVLKALGGAALDAGPIVADLGACGERLRSLIVDGSALVDRLGREGKRVVVEAPFGTMVDMDAGTYPFVVGGTCVAGGASAGVGVAPRAIGPVIGVAKAYTTRVGPGPFPTELFGDLAKKLQQAGGELGPTTGRPRRCGMFDVPAVRYAARINGFDSLVLTKLDVLSGMDEVPVCVGYHLDGQLRDEPPYDGLSRVEPLWEKLPGWSVPLKGIGTFEDLPENAQRYIRTIEQTVGIPISMVGVGPDRGETITLRDPWTKR